MTDSSLLPAAFAGVFALIGLAILAQGLRTTGVLIPMIRTETSDIASLSSGLVEIEGQARDRDNLLTAPLTGTGCVACGTVPL
ncbi:hypothetical protein [Halorientalis sp.]|uniref:hypothetical protein n=1 Tax=Halorientalis sp. TaxID=1931229 RepID=UPI002619D7EE|nr:hypothetical protein [Halorientalis sp.]